jgi:hypothetical protein
VMKINARPEALHIEKSNRAIDSGKSGPKFLSIILPKGGYTSLSSIIKSSTRPFSIIGEQFYVDNQRWTAFISSRCFHGLRWRIPPSIEVDLQLRGITLCRHLGQATCSRVRRLGWPSASGEDEEEDHRKKSHSARLSHPRCLSAILSFGRSAASLPTGRTRAPVRTCTKNTLSSSRIAIADPAHHDFRTERPSPWTPIDASAEVVQER